MPQRDGERTDEFGDVIWLADHADHLGRALPADPDDVVGAERIA